MLYSLVKPLLFSVDPELAHDVSLEMLQQFRSVIPAKKIRKPVTVLGLEFPNPVGLAAGLDKNADYLDGLSKLGFGFIEVGSVTPRAQPGNAKPRIFRLPSQQCLINRMGFNNLGVDHMMNRISQFDRQCILGINIGKNLDTPVNQALSDYGLLLEKVYQQADYITINISSPNTPGLRNLQNESALEALLSGIDGIRKSLEDQYQYSRPIAVKLSPDLDDKAIPTLSDILRKYRIDALIATNTTLSREYVKGHPLADEAGGLSGEALREQSRHVLAGFYQELGDDIPIISVGGIDSAEEARLRLELGAKLVQIYTALIFQGPGLINRILRSL
ncbi:MAG: quinone-dependent dihydroorotate dehydrogenase [Pseudomonadota bacterium]